LGSRSSGERFARLIKFIVVGVAEPRIEPAIESPLMAERDRIGLTAKVTATLLEGM